MILPPQWELIFWLDSSFILIFDLVYDCDWLNRECSPHGHYSNGHEGDIPYSNQSQSQIDTVKSLLLICRSSTGAWRTNESQRLDNMISHQHCRAVKLPWIFLGAPLNFNGAPRNIQGNLDRYEAVAQPAMAAVYHALFPCGNTTHFLLILPSVWPYHSAVDYICAHLPCQLCISWTSALWVCIEDVCGQFQSQPAWFHESVSRQAEAFQWQWRE